MQRRIIIDVDIQASNCRIFTVTFIKNHAEILQKNLAENVDNRKLPHC